MPDLGKYALWVLASYGVTLGLLMAITVLSLARAARVRRALAEIEDGRAARRSDGARTPSAAKVPVAESTDG
jgi:heme exporter protein D